MMSVERLELVTLSKIDFIHAIYLAVGEVWHGRGTRQIAERLKMNVTTRITYNMKHVMEKYPEVFYYNIGSVPVYIDWSKVPEERKEAIKKAQSDKVFSMGYRRYYDGTVTKIRLGSELLADCEFIRLTTGGSEEGNWSVKTE